MIINRTRDLLQAIGLEIFLDHIGGGGSNIMAFREVLLTAIKPRGCGRLACLTIRFVLVTTLLSIGVL